MKDNLPSVVSEPDDVAASIRAYIRNHPELRHDDYKDEYDNRLDGHCYVASEAYFHAHPDGGEGGRFVPERTVHQNGDTHWWLRDKRQGTVIDLIQPNVPPEPPYHPYQTGTRCGFLTGYETASQRTQSVLKELGYLDE